MARHLIIAIRKNQEAGMIIGRLAMKSYLKGRPYTDFEDDIYLFATAGINVGDLIHICQESQKVCLQLGKAAHDKLFDQSSSHDLSLSNDGYYCR